jgi:hypothetical protein
MISCISKLIEISSDALCDMPPPDLERVHGERLAELTRICARRNGFLAFESALHVFPVSFECAEMTFQAWNGVEAWKYAYGGVVDDVMFFAEDIFGDQFGILNDSVVLFRSETAELEPIASSLEEWACRMLTEYEDLTGYTIARAWQREHGPLAKGTRLTGKVPFVLGGAYDLSNLHAAESLKLMRFRGDIYCQIRDQPDGAQLKVTVKNPS